MIVEGSHSARGEPARRLGLRWINTRGLGLGFKIGFRIRVRVRVRESIEELEFGLGLS